MKDFCRAHVAAVRCAVVYDKPASTVRCEYVWRTTDRWIDFPWSVPAPVTGGTQQGRVTGAAGTVHCGRPRIPGCIMKP